MACRPLKRKVTDLSDVLKGIRVLDFGRFVAGPFCGALLADLGADVIRVERVGGGEDRFITPVRRGGTGAFYLQSNRNKRAITLSPLKPEGRQIVRRLVANADVVLVNLPPAAIKEMNLDYESLSGIKPDIILTAITAFGDDGPYRDRVGFDGVAQVMSGATYLAGSSDKPQRSMAPYVDFDTAMAATIGTLAAIMERQRTGKGQQVSCDLLRTAMNFCSMHLVEQAVTRADRVPTGNRSPTSAPTDLFRCKDGWLLTQVAGQPIWQRWVKLMGEEHWLSDPRFRDDMSRGEHSDVVCDRMARWCAERSVKEAIAACEMHRIPCGPLYSPQQALDDPHVQAAGYLRHLVYPGVGEVPVVETPFRLSRSDVGVKRRAPTLSEHTDSVMAELGYSANEIELLKEKRVI